MSEHKWLTSRRLQEAHLYISPELNWDSAPLTSSYPPCRCRRRQRPAQHNKTKEVWKTASYLHRLKQDGQRRVLVSTFEDAVKSMEFCCSGCFSEHSTLSALTPKIAT
ncbi:PREDICTED: uncharacterized protein LOC103902166 [Aptenodytes forsteri]|uniref:uncharacterized protein LOC103902166 n=1 Tax=Aptenodytes forsteri TaxID=9233 RepID=UPI0004F4A686|nr:PREDICTED: uncharacterized protein LOC103902166 [Aptenodytes forsteri]